MAAYTEPNNLKDFLVWEEERGKSREKIVVLTGENIALAEVMGKITLSCPATGTVGGGNTGASTCGSVTAGPKAKIGTYTLTCIAEATGAGTFAVADPDGFALASATVGTAYVNDHINFTLTDAGEDSNLGDIYTIEITAGSGKYVEVDAAAVDGSQNAAGIAIANYNATSADTAGVAIVRDAIITSSNLVWPSSATAPEKASWLAQLAETGIIVREES